MKRKSLHDPVVLKSMYLKNALIRSATNESMANSFSEPSEKMILLYEELARYVGLIITGFCYPSEDEIVKDHMLGLTNGLKKQDSTEFSCIWHMDISCQNFSVRKQIQEQIVTALPRAKLPALLSKCFRNFAHSFLNSFTSVRKCTAVTLKQME